MSHALLILRPTTSLPRGWQRAFLIGVADNTLSYLVLSSSSNTWERILIVRPGTMTVQQIVGDFRNGVITVNHEYQRGEVWNDEQRRKLIDSLFRGYQLPIFYLHEIRRSNAQGDTWRVHQIIDGQQRCNALDRFINGDLQLYDVNDASSKLPSFLRDTNEYPCPWGGQRYNTLPEELQKQLLNMDLPIAFIEQATDYEVRDLFIRLQSGSSLNNQEKRDAYPGQFSQFIVQLGGKSARGIEGYDFFRKLVRRQSGEDRGNIRQLAAQITMLFLGRRETGNVVEIGRPYIDEYYDTKQDFDASNPNCRRLLEIIRKLEGLLANWSGPRLYGHNAIALILFVDSIWDDYTRNWESSFQNALDQFFTLYEVGRNANKNREPHPAWQNYGQYASASSDSRERVSRRQEFFDGCMVSFLGDSLVPLDPQRNFTDHERRFIYWRDSRDCRVCRMPVPWDLAVFHHVKPHAQGGRTVVDNGALVHSQCHPLSEADVAKFAETFEPYANSPITP